MFSGADRDERADQVADHVVQEGIRGKFEADERAVMGHARDMKGFHRRLRLALGGAERAEIVLTDDPVGGRLHRLRIERPMVPADATGA